MVFIKKTVLQELQGQAARAAELEPFAGLAGVVADRMSQIQRELPGLSPEDLVGQVVDSIALEKRTAALRTLFNRLPLEKRYALLEARLGQDVAEEVYGAELTRAKAKSEYDKQIEDLAYSGQTYQRVDLSKIPEGGITTACLYGDSRHGVWNRIIKAASVGQGRFMVMSDKPLEGSSTSYTIDPVMMPGQVVELGGALGRENVDPYMVYRDGGLRMRFDGIPDAYDLRAQGYDFHGSKINLTIASLAVGDQTLLSVK